MRRKKVTGREKVSGGGGGGGGGAIFDNSNTCNVYSKG